MVYRVCFPKFIRFPFVDKELSYEFALHQAKLHLNLQRAVDEAFGFAFRGGFWLPKRLRHFRGAERPAAASRHHAVSKRGWGSRGVGFLVECDRGLAAPFMLVAPCMSEPGEVESARRESEAGIANRHTDEMPNCLLQ